VIFFPRRSSARRFLRTIEGRTESGLPPLGADDNILIEYGLSAEIEARLKAHLMMEAVQRSRVAGIIDLRPASAHWHVHMTMMSFQRRASRRLVTLERELPIPHGFCEKQDRPPPALMERPQRACDAEYQELVRPNAAWCRQYRFIRGAFNGLESRRRRAPYRV